MYPHIAIANNYYDTKTVTSYVAMCMDTALTVGIDGQKLYLFTSLCLFLMFLLCFHNTFAILSYLDIISVSSLS